MSFDPLQTFLLLLLPQDYERVPEFVGGDVHFLCSGQTPANPKPYTLIRNFGSGAYIGSTSHTQLQALPRLYLQCQVRRKA